MKKTKNILVGVLMGSDSDWPVMRLAGEALDEFGVGWEARVLSAHRTPGDVAEYAREASSRGLRVLIAGAGGAAHLAGAVAAWTVVPVIGVPIESRSLRGLDSLLSMVQMPAGVPVGSVGIGAGRNAGLLAVQVLGVGDAGLRGRYGEFKARLAEESRARDGKLQGQGGGGGFGGG
jgi:5-(carboxyamino)imidazole ribonucleotide mutase